MRTLGKGAFTELSLDVIRTFQKHNATKYDTIVLCAGLIGSQFKDIEPKAARDTLNEVYSMISGYISKLERDKST